MSVSAADLSSFLETHEHTLFGDEPFRERAFDDAEFAERKHRLIDCLGDIDVDVMVVTAPDTLAWLHGYRSRWYRHHTSTALPPAQCTVLDTGVDTGTSSMYMIESGYHLDLVRASSVLDDVRAMPGSDLTHEPGLDDYVRFLVDQIGVSPRRIGLELWSCLPSPAVSRRVEEALIEAGHSIIDVSTPVRGLRRLKSPAEIAHIERAMAACDAGLLAIAQHVRPGMTELEAWAVYQTASVAAGGEPAVLHETVASGALMPTLHRLSSRRPLKRGHVFHADAASSYFGYHARGTRPYLIGRPADELVELVALAAGARDVLLEVGTVGTPWQTLFAELRAYYTSTGVEGGAAGYELGVSVAPADWVNEFTWGVDDAENSGVIEAGLVTNFETWNVVALVDTVVFEDSGPRILSTVAPELMVIDR